jgi:hypothetical protein
MIKFESETIGHKEEFRYNIALLAKYFKPQRISSRTLIVSVRGNKV